jgi:putative membrane protein
VVSRCRNSVSVAIDLASKTVIEQLGLGVAERLSATVAEGLFVGVRVARLGLVAMQYCRPIPFTAEELPQLRHLLSEVVRSGR